ncbi:MAG TPA: BACON domain-containing protein [Vicinamibacterales bacterium]|nr:BACON domain-containing protein [Vicinamibacterales bacterium]
MTSPSTAKCATSASATPASFSAAGGSGTLAITTNRECPWSAAPASGWIQLDGAASGQGTANVSFKVAANADPVVRSGAISVGDQQVGITQEAAPCVFTVNPRDDSVDAAGGRKTIAVTASSAQCAWTARSDVDWLVIVEGAQGTGNGQVTYEARATAGPTRSGTLLVAGQVVTVTQAQGCSASITPNSQSAPASGGTGSVAVATEAGCPWSASSNVSWIVITSGQTGTGPGTVAFSLNASSGPARSGTLTVAGHTFTVNQASGCSYALAPASQDVGAEAGTGSFAVNTAAGCAWTATSGASWIRITSGGSGNGAGTVSFSFEFNPMGIPARSGAISVNNQTFTLNQAAGVPCVFTLVPTSQNFSNAGGTGSFAVDTVLTCPWTAYSNDSWITITGHPSGAGGGTVSFTVAANPPGSPARVGTISVRGPIFTISQAAGATIAPTASATAPADGGAGDGPPLPAWEHSMFGVQEAVRPVRRR